MFSIAVKQRLKEWVKNNPKVWEENEHGVSHFEFVQSALSDIYGFQPWVLELVEEINSEKHYETEQGTV